MPNQFEVFAHPTPKRSFYPYLLVLQHDGMPISTDVIVAPLVNLPKHEWSRLYPEIEIGGRLLVLLTPALGRVPSWLLRENVGNGGDYRDRIIAAIDLVFAGS